MFRGPDSPGIAYITEDKVELEYEFPLAEIMYDFYDRLKSSTKGYASMDYEPAGYKKSDLIVNENSALLLSYLSLLRYTALSAFCF